MSSKYQYTSLRSPNDETKDTLPPRPRVTYPGVGRWGFFAAGVLSTLATVFVVWVVSIHIHLPTHLSSDADLVRKPHKMTHATESIYSVPRSKESDEQWRLLFPLRGARFSSDDEPRPFTLSVFHQLHCLASIRRSYFALQTGKDDAEGTPTDAHIRHCIDFLRQVVMCNADRTKEIYGTDSYEAVHMCYDWDEVLESTEAWKLEIHTEKDSSKAGDQDGDE